MPTDNMNANVFIDSQQFAKDMSTLIDLENSNLPIDYFTSVLPRAQYGDEAAVPVRFNETPASYMISTGDVKQGAIFNGMSYTADDNLERANSDPVVCVVKEPRSSKS